MNTNPAAKITRSKVPADIYNWVLPHLCRVSWSTGYSVKGVPKNRGVTVDAWEIHFAPPFRRPGIVALIALQTTGTNVMDSTMAGLNTT